MEKVLAVNIDEKDMEVVYKICSQMKVMLIRVKSEDLMTPIEDLLSRPAYRTNQDKVEAKGDSLIIMCDLAEKHMDKLLAGLRLCNSGIKHKAVITPTNRKWNVLRMLAEMERERQVYERKL